MTLTDEQIQKLVKKYVDEARQQIEESHLEANYRDRYEAERLAETIDGLMVDKAEVLASSNFRTIKNEVTQFLTKNGVDVVDAESLSFKKTCREYLRGQVALYKYNAKLLRGGSTLNAVDYMVDSVKAAAPVVTTIKQARKLSELFPKFLEERKVTKDIDDGTVSAYQSSFSDLIEILGDVVPDKVEYDQALQYRGTLIKLPAHRTKQKAYRDLSISELLALPVEESKRLTPKTVNGKIANCITFFEWLVDRGHSQKNPFSHIKLSTKKTKSSYDSFTAKDLELIFNSPLYQAEHEFRNTANGKAAMWWLMPMLLFTGARTGELVQMRLDDIYRIDGVLTAHIKADEAHGQTVKTAAGRRSVPIHPALLALGFEEYLERMRSAGHERVFEAFKLYHDKSSRSASRWFREVYKKRFLSEALGEGKKVLHSFRSTFITAALNNDVSDRLVQQLVGHSNSKELGATAIYDKGADVPQLFEAIKKLRFDGVDFERLVDGWKGLKLK